MIPMVNLNMAVEKELELECQGKLRRTRRFIGDVGTDANWYRSKIERESDNAFNQREVGQVTETNTHQDVQASFLDRLTDLFFARRQQTGC